MSSLMKDSGISWIGEIPYEWQISRLGAEFKPRNTKVSDVDYMPLSVTKLPEGIVPQMSQVAKSDAHDARKLVLKGDFVINSRSDRKMSCGISNYDGSVSLINIVLEPVGRISSKYSHYLLKNYLFAEEFYRWGHGIVADLWTTNISDMKRISIPIPPINIQNEIVCKIQQKEQQVDKLISIQEKEIDRLKKYRQSLITEVITKGLNKHVQMKDSEINWIGKIPNDWNIVKLKNIGKCRNGLTYSPNDMCSENEGVLVLRSSNVQNGKLCFDDNVYVNLDIKEDLYVKENDILICSRNGSRKLIGKNAIIDGNLVASFGAFMMIFRTEYNSNYVKYILDSHVFNYYLGMFFTTTINQLTGENFDNIKVPFSSNDVEVNEIVNFLNKKCETLDKLIELKIKKIEKLNEYKKSLIYEYVTGKRTVNS